MSQDEEKPRKPSRWSLVVTTALSIGATVIVAWYQIARSQQEAALAELERARNVRANLVSIVEEHVLNNKPIDVARLARLIDLRRREEGVTTPVGVLEIIEKAEYNILDSRYLDFQKKEAYKLLFDSLYANLGSRRVAFQGVPNADLLSNVAKSIQEGKAQEALENLQRFAEAYRKDSVTQRRLEPPLIDALLRKPDGFLLLITFMLTFATFSFFSMNPRIREIIRSLLFADSSSALARRLRLMSPSSPGYLETCRELIRASRNAISLAPALEKLMSASPLEEEREFLSAECASREAAGRKRSAALIRSFLDKAQEPTETKS